MCRIHPATRHEFAPTDIASTHISIILHSRRYFNRLQKIYNEKIIKFGLVMLAYSNHFKQFPFRDRGGCLPTAIFTADKVI